jgi:hypothetical protein
MRSAVSAGVSPIFNNCAPTSGWCAESAPTTKMPSGKMYKLIGNLLNVIFRAARNGQRLVCPWFSDASIRDMPT